MGLMNLVALLIVFFLMAAAIIFLVAKLLLYRNEFKKIELQSEEFDQDLKQKESRIEELEANIKLKLEKARNVHQRMLPDKLAEPEDYFVSDYYQPAEYIGGDYYNFFKIDHGAMDPFFDQYLLYFFDVSGHGIDSTLLSIFVNGSIENYFKLRHNPGEKISTRELMNYIDRQYQKEGFPDDYLVCLFIAVLDRKKNTLSYSSGGFQYPIYKLDAEGNMEEINIGGLPISTALGTLSDSRQEKTVNFKKNTTLFLSTDGLLEQGRGSQIYYQQLQQLLKRYKFLPAPFLNDLIRSDFYNFTGDNQGEDDITYLLLERPEGEIINFKLEQENFENKKAEIIEFLNQSLWARHSQLQTLREIILTQLKKTGPEIKIKALNNQQLLMFCLENNEGGWEALIKNFPSLNSIAEKKINLSGNAERIIFNRKEIYFSLNSSNSKIYLMLIKKDNFN
jgi:sigma-B regulation protein RsbU (phosphoserine phosphatase)